MVYAINSLAKHASAMLGGHPVTVAHQPVMLCVMTTHVML